VTVVAGLPDISITLYMIVYVHNTFVLIVQLLTILAVIFPSSASIAVAQESVYVLFCVIVSVPEPLSVITGILPLITCTVLITQVALFHWLSIALYSIL
jgi:hypothetical protein